MKQSDDDLLYYYQSELSYLRKEGSNFGKKYPKIAGHLELGIDESPDPHIERLIESFAFLTAKIQKNLENEFPELSTSLLQNINPQLVSPIPSMSIAHINVEELDLPAIPLTIEKDHQLSAYTNVGQRCKFRTCYPIELYPLKVEIARIGSTGEFPFLSEQQEKPVLHLRIQATSDIELDKIPLKKLRLYLHADRWLSNYLYELLFCNVSKLILVNDSLSNKTSHSDNLRVSPVGFNDDESALPYPQNVNTSYRLLQEYFTFPEKFMFFDLVNIDLTDCKNFFDVIFIFDNYLDRELSIDKENFLLGCSPVVNLFNQISEPIRINNFTHDYRINPDNQREQITEIHSIQSIEPTSNNVESPETIKPYFSFGHHSEINKGEVYWYARRESTNRPELTGSDVFLSLVDSNFSPRSTKLKTLFARLLCTNRALPASIPQGTWLRSEDSYSNLDITLIRKPTRPIDAPQGKQLWRLISSLSLNYLSLNSGTDSLLALKEILSLYDFESRASTRQQISGITSLETKPSITRLGNDNWRGFCRGIDVILEFDLELFAGNSAYLFAAVLNHFLPMYTSINSFTRLVTKKKQAKGEIWKVWKPRTGNRQIL